MTTFTAADFTPTTNNDATPLGGFNFLASSEVMQVLPYHNHPSMPATLPNEDANIASIPMDVGALYAGLPAALAEVYNNDPNALVQSTNFTGKIDPRLYGNSQHLRAYWTAAMTLSSWWHHQKLGPQGPGTSDSNPLDVPFSDLQKQNFIGNLGSHPQPEMLYAAYNNYGAQGAGFDPAVSNTFFNLGYGHEAFSWGADGSLTVKDVYFFEGFADFGVAQDWNSAWSQSPMNFLVALGRAMAAAAFIGIPATGQAAERWFLQRLLNMLGVNLEDDDRPFRAHKTWAWNPIVGSAAAMHIKTTWTAQEIFDNNPELFWAAVRAGLIPLSVFETLQGVHYAEHPMGGNSNNLPGMNDNAPVNGNIDPNNVASISFGGAATYPKPFTSWLQNVDDANFILGPYAKFGNIPGRIIIITDSPGFGELGFWIQRWDVHDDGPVIQQHGYQTKNEWFNSAMKAPVPVRYLHWPGRPWVKVQMAYHGFSTGSPPEQVWTTDLALATAVLGSMTLPLLFASGAAGLLTLL